MGEKYQRTNKAMVMTLEQIAQLEKMWLMVHDSLQILDKYIVEEGEQFKLSEAEDILDVREALGNVILLTRSKWITLGTAIRKFGGHKLQ